MPKPVSHEIEAACRLLFGVGATLAFLRTLAPEQLKLTYRRLALESHPDRARALGRSAGELNELCQRINGAYDVLSRYLREVARRARAASESVPMRCAATGARTEDQRAPRPNERPRQPEPSDQPRCGAKQSERAQARSANSETFATGRIPASELRLCQYLYYSGRISWDAMIRAICWQRGQRPVFGQIAQAHGWLTSEAVHRILQERRPGEKIGEAAVRTGRLASERCRSLLAEQRAQEPRIGEYFVRHGVLSRAEIDAVVAAQREHNAGLCSRARPWRVASAG